MKQFQKFSLQTFTNRGFSLTPLEFKDVVPFAVKRMYYFQNMDDEHVTSQHCHKIEQEVFIQAKGSSVAVIDQGSGKEEVLLSEGDAIYCPAYVWHGFIKPSKDALLIALSSTNYSVDRSDYIEDYQAYLTFRNEKLKS